MAKAKTDDELAAERQVLADQAAALDRQIAARQLERIQAFSDAFAALVKPADVESLKSIHGGLTGQASTNIGNIVSVLSAAPALLGIEIDRLTALSADPASTPMPTPDPAPVSAEA
ncbi:MAG: hypothetical protein LCH57_01975 [Proteobacteria bacterium]|nr:hypothetical protein [Pseudomonadota bacterium]